jgi:hypothetical protein
LLEEQACFEENCLFDLTVKWLDVNKILSGSLIFVRPYIISNDGSEESQLDATITVY